MSDDKTEAVDLWHLPRAVSDVLQLLMFVAL